MFLKVKRPANGVFDFCHDRSFETAPLVGQFVMLHRAYGLAIRIGLQFEPGHTRERHLIPAAAGLLG